MLLSSIGLFFRDKPTVTEGLARRVERGRECVGTKRSMLREVQLPSSWDSTMDVMHVAAISYLARSITVVGWAGEVDDTSCGIESRTMIWYKSSSVAIITPVSQRSGL